MLRWQAVTKILLTSLVLASLFTSSPAALALTIVPSEDPAEIVDAADLIVAGFPIDRGTSHRVGELAIVTDWLIFPQFVLRGQWPYEPLVMRTAGGDVDGMSIAGTSLGPAGTPYVFFLRATDETCFGESGTWPQAGGAAAAASGSGAAAAASSVGPSAAAAPGPGADDSATCIVWRPTIEFLGIQPVYSLKAAPGTGRVTIGLGDPEIAAALQNTLSGRRFAVEYVVPGS